MKSAIDIHNCLKQPQNSKQIKYFHHYSESEFLFPALIFTNEWMKWWLKHNENQLWWLRWYSNHVNFKTSTATSLGLVYFLRSLKAKRNNKSMLFEQWLHIYYSTLILYYFSNTYWRHIQTVEDNLTATPSSCYLKQ